MLLILKTPVDQKHGEKFEEKKIGDRSRNCRNGP